MSLARLAALLLLVMPVGASARAGGGSNYVAPSHTYSAPAYHPSPSPAYSPPSRSYSSPSYSSPSPSSSTHSLPSPVYSTLPSSNSYSSSPSSYSSQPVSEGHRSHAGFWLLMLVFVLMVLWVCWVAVPRAVSGSRTQQVIAQATGPRGRSLSAIVEELRAQDPAFDPEAFSKRAREIFYLVQEAWFLRTYALTRASMSDGVLRRFMTQQRLMQVEGVRNAVDDMRVLEVRLLDAAVTPFFQVLDVAIDAAARDVDVLAGLSDAAARAKARAQPAQRFTEIWTFARRPGATTRAGFSVSEGKCPNCGAAYPGGPTAQCAYCQAIVNSGHHDWVLCEITQAEEHRLARPISDFAEMLSRDPEFNPYAVEDRASLVFWKLCAARGTNQVAPLASVCAPELKDQVAATIERRRERGQRLSFHQAAVGAVQLVRLDVSPGDEDPVDRAHVRVNWSARTGVVGENEQGTQAAVVSSRSTVLTLARSASAVTPPGRGLATARCGACGAAPSRDDLDACESCGVELGASLADWVLEAETPYEAWKATPPPPDAVASTAPSVPDFAYPSERRRLLYTMATMARADGVVAEKERKLLLACADRWHLPRGEVSALLDRSANAELDLPERGSPAAQAFLEGLIAMALADGRIDSTEDRLLKTAAQRLAFPAARLADLISHVRLELAPHT